MRREIIDVPDLTDPDLAEPREALEAALIAIIGIDRADVDTAGKQVTVTYDEGWIGEAGVMGVIQDAGFTVPAMPTRRQH